jgi:DnaA family protein
MRQLLLDIRPDAPPAFDNFIEGENAPALEGLRAAVIGAGHVMIWGPRGSGRSHLLRAAINEASAAGRPALHVEADRLDGRFLPAPSTLVAIDDIEGLCADAQIALFNAFNRAFEQGLTLLLTAQRPPRELELREDLRTRIGQTLVFEIKPLDDPTRSHILLTLAQRRGLSIGEDVVQFLLRHGRRDLPALISVLDALDRASLEHKRPVTLPLLRELMQAGLDI